MHCCMYMHVFRPIQIVSNVRVRVFRMKCLSTARLRSGYALRYTQIYCDTCALQALALTDSHRYRLSLLQTRTVTDFRPYRLAPLQTFALTDSHRYRLSLLQTRTVIGSRRYRLAPLQTCTFTYSHYYRVTPLQTHAVKDSRR